MTLNELAPWVIAICGMTLVGVIIVSILATTPPERTLSWYRKNEPYCSYCGGPMILHTSFPNGGASLKVWMCKQHILEDDDHDATVISALPRFNRKTGIKNP